MSPTADEYRELDREYVRLTREGMSVIEAHRRVYGGDSSPSILRLSSPPAGPLIVSDREAIVAYLTAAAGQSLAQAEAKAEAAVAAPLLDSSATLIARSRAWALRPEARAADDA